MVIAKLRNDSVVSQVIMEIGVIYLSIYVIGGSRTAFL